MRLISDVCYGKAGHTDQYLDIYLPDKNNFKVVVYMHGGGMEAGDKTQFATVGEYVAGHRICFN